MERGQDAREVQCLAGASTTTTYEPPEVVCAILSLKHVHLGWQIQRRIVPSVDHAKETRVRKWRARKPPKESTLPPSGIGRLTVSARDLKIYTSPSQTRQV